MQRTDEQPTRILRPDPASIFGVCAYCSTPDVARVLVTGEDGCSNPRLVCADPAFCAAAQPVHPLTITADDRYTITEAGLRALTDAVPGMMPGTAGQVLRDAAVYLQRHGWIQGAYYDGTSQVFTPAACLVGAIGMVCYGGPVDAPAQHFDDPGYPDFEEAVLHLDRYLLADGYPESYEFNDAKGRTLTDVTCALRRAAACTADELIDALRAIDRHNEQIALLFGGDDE